MNYDLMFGFTIGAFLGLYIPSRSLIFSIYGALDFLLLYILVSSLKQN